MRNDPIRDDPTPILALALGGRRRASRASAALILAVWVLLWAWMLAGVVVPLSRIAPPGPQQRAEEQAFRA